MRAPLGEALWTMWTDHFAHNAPHDAPRMRTLLDGIESLMAATSEALGANSPYAAEPQDLRRAADGGIGFYAGSFGRYRGAKTLLPPSGTDGLISVSSMYENTGISLDILRKEFANGTTPPVLNLTFDGTRNEHDKTKTESFIHYL